MSRLTEKINETDYKLTKYNDIVRANARLKLGKLEDLEEELGCPLEVVFKALKQDYIYTKNGRCLGGVELGIYGVDWCICCGLRLQIRVADYKNSWWLREDKSE